MLNKPTAHKVNYYRSLFFQIGLLMALVFCLFAFEVKSDYTKPNSDIYQPTETSYHEVIREVWITPKKRVPIKIIKLLHPNPTPNPILTEPARIPEPQPIAIDPSGKNATQKPTHTIVLTKNPPAAAVRPPLILIPEIMPEFPGGEVELIKFLSKTRYCQREKDTGIQGTVYVSFVVNEFGKAVDVKVLRGVSNCLNKKAVEKIKSMPLWIPGKQGDHLVRVPMTVPFAFKLK